MGTCCKSNDGGEREEITNIQLNPAGYEGKKDQEENEKFTFEKAVEVLNNFDKKLIDQKYFKNGVQIKKTGIFKSELLLNNRLINVIYKIAEFKSSHNNALKLFNEYLSILTLKNCQCILRSYGYYIDKEREMIGFLYEYLDDNLEHYIYLKSLDLEKKLIIIKKLIETLIYIHSKGIILLDLSPKNIMFDINWKMRLSKFENSINREKSYLNRMVQFTSKVNIAPEILLNSEGSSPSSDIWSLGILITQLFTGITSYIYSERPDNMKDHEYNTSLLKELNNKTTPKIIDFFENSNQILPIKALVIGMLRFDNDERPDIFKVAENFNQYFTRMKMEKFLIKYEKSQREEYYKFFK